MSDTTKIFLAAEWKNLVMANYVVDPSVLSPYLPAYTELDYFENKCYVSLVGFMFDKVRVKGISIPFHTKFPEVNLRFYVKHTAKDGSIKRGVVFISEIVPKAAIAWVANNLYKEKYIATAMSYTNSTKENQLIFNYGWQWKGKSNLLSAAVINQPSPVVQTTEEAFIFEHYYGYAKVNNSRTNQYQVEHPVWNVYPVTGYTITCSFKELYGNNFAFLDDATPGSVFVAEGSAVVIRGKTVLGNA